MSRPFKILPKPSPRRATPPLAWRPDRPDDLCGPAATVARRLVAKARKLHSNPAVPVKILLYGPPGVGKTSIADMVAGELAGTRFAVEEFNGKLVTVELVKQWMGGLCAGSLFGVYSVRIINEMDRCSRDAQDLLLSYLDRLPPGRAVIGTSNLQLDLLTERFQTRFQSIKLAAPSTEEIASMLRRHWPVDQATSLRIAVGSGGCVRAALADLETWLDAEGLS
jgi:replication-associated recombination protein RarA